MLDIPVYRNAAYGVALPRPFNDWVFSASASSQTTTVLFHPRRGSLREQLWGALVLASFDGPVPLAAAADQRVAGEWQETLGSSFTVLTRDSLTVRGLPAVHVVMAGAVNRVALDVEEYYVARGRDLVILQFRYPRGLPRDSVAAGYERSFDGLAIEPRGAAVAGVPRQATQPVVPAADAAINGALAASPWRPRAYDALVRFDRAAARVDLTVRVEIVNDDTSPHDSVSLALRWPFVLDDVRGATGATLAVERGVVATVRLPRPVEPQAATAVTVAYHVTSQTGERAAAPRAGVIVSTEWLLCLTDWLPVAWPWTDALGQPVPAPRARFTVRFDLPEDFVAVSAGRLAADVRTGDRRRQTWVSDDESLPAQAFAAGRMRRLAARADELVVVRVWAPALAGDSSDGAVRADALAAEILRSWEFYSRAFGRLPEGDLDVVLAGEVEPCVAGATLFLPAAIAAGAIREAVARVWWGGSVHFVGPGATWLAGALPAWSALAMLAATDGDSVRDRLVREAEASRQPLAAMEAARRAVGDAGFRVAVRTFFLNHRRRSATLADLADLLGPDGAAALPQ